MRTPTTLVTFCLAALSSAASASAQSIPLTTLTLNGTASIAGGSYIQLTSVGSQAGSAFIPAPYTLGPTTSFEVTFVYDEYTVAGVTPADGLAFVAQNTSMGPNYLGVGGSGMGFFTLTTVPAIGATFDFYPNAYTGTTAGAASIALPIGQDLVTAYPTPPVFVYGGVARRYVWVEYNNLQKALQIYYSTTSTKPAKPILGTILAQDLSTEFGGQVYFGFTGGTGALFAQQYILEMFVHLEN